ncbi:ybaK [Symbiodinium natans]|uniref:YbaK protein n=1 Tax=Symbiodinium natans TaxID=878477 RepID=A0A812TGY5_9DINO|nr:ybaK [Symbiodinium natans]
MVSHGTLGALRSLGLEVAQSSPCVLCGPKAPRLRGLCTSPRRGAEDRGSAPPESPPSLQTPATLFLESLSVTFQQHAVSKEDMREGESVTQSFARQVGLQDDSSMVKTMVFDIDKGAAQEPIFVLQHGNKKVDTKRLAAAAGVKRDHVKPTKPERATAFTGYVFGGTTVFGSNTQLKTYVETSIFNLETVYVNGGSTSLCLSMSSADFERALGECTRVEVAGG